MLKGIAATPIGDIALRDPVRAKPDAALIDVVTQMRAQKRGACIVVDERDQLLGIFTERDLMLRIDHGNRDWHRTPVADVMTRNPTRVSVSESTATALQRMRGGTFRHLPVIDQHGAPVGLISIRDILRHIVDYFPEDFINLPPDPNHEARRRWGG